jgi:hypothetical protein
VKTFYYADTRGYKAEVNLGDCPMCAHDKAVEMVSVATIGFDGKARIMSVPKETYLKVVNAAMTMVSVQHQQAKARKFRYNRMIYQGARRGTR